MWIIVSVSSFVRRFFESSSHVPLKSCAAIFRCRSASVFKSVRAISRLPISAEVGLGRFELPSQALPPSAYEGPKARRIDQATPQPQAREQPARAINTLSHGDRRFGARACASRAAARTAASLVFFGRHPVALIRSSASCMTRTSPTQPRPPPLPPVQANSTSRSPSSSHTASAMDLTVIASSLPRLYSETGRSAARTPVLAVQPRERRRDDGEV